MPVDPAIAFVVDAANRAPEPDPSLSVASRREAAHDMMEATFYALAEDPPPVGSVEDHSVESEGGRITVRSYTPRGPGPFPGHLYLHGGGFWLGTLDHAELTCADLCARSGCIVLSVGYRLAPEHKFPVAPEDCYSALCWADSSRSGLRLRDGPLSVGGASAGGNLAAVVALMARDRGGPPPCFQLLEVPVTDLTMSRRSVVENGEGYVLTRKAMEQYREYYLADPSEARNPYASPLCASDLSGLPDALVMTAEMDPLRDEGEAYARRLSEAGVPTELVRWAGHIHGAGAFTKILPSARAYRDKAVVSLRRAHGLPA